MFAAVAQCFGAFFTKSHPLKRYRDRLVGHEGISTLDPSLLPTAHNDRRLIFIGDVHGCLEELEHLIRKVGFNPRNDHLIFVGDLVAKGPFSLETIDFIDDLSHSASCVRGNHDDKLLQWHAYLTERSKDTDLEEERLPDGLSRRDEHRLLAKNLTQLETGYLESLPYILLIPKSGSCLKRNYLVCHAGLLANVPLAKQKCWDVNNMRNVTRHGHAIDDREEGEGWFLAWEKAQSHLPSHEQVTVVYGHDAGRGLNIRHTTRGLDSRCVRGGQLTAMVVDAHGEHFVQVEAKKRYD
ncbi:Metallo-dependent phosphatase-like protein [Protomyces lactucae-debilis]|uniref:Metallo-dependent phosphatase-like protein n=1 Tax=Protomyces lactucae-debilis TaxID=2754530 RepID=A0A1Y2F6Z0_PROLT|nr:Metallo-dependent phosphatase-like protein [Protomyces lactucae-debilis]ORY79427.1 Metallo-dependent phosphatase-like protein [Protomyces lactucae-debilis]